MKISIILIALAVSISGPAFAAGKDDHGHKAQSMHGGVTAQAKDVDYELVAKADKLQLFMRDHGKPVDVSSMTGGSAGIRTEPDIFHSKLLFQLNKIA